MIEKGSVANHDTADTSGNTSQQFVLVMEMIQQLMQRQAEDKAQMMQMVRSLASERVMSGIPSPIPQVRFDQNPPLIHEGNGRNEGTHTGNVNERRVTLAKNRNQGIDHTGRQPAYDKGFDNGIAEMGMRRSRVSDADHDIGTGNDNERVTRVLRTVSPRDLMVSVQTRLTVQTIMFINGKQNPTDGKIGKVSMKVNMWYSQTHS